MRKNYTLARLYVEPDLRPGAIIDISGNGFLHIVKVLRKSKGDIIRLFNGRDGEWAAEIITISRRSAGLAIKTRLKDFYAPPDMELLFAPLKKERMRFLTEKACELGVRRLRPVITASTQHNIRPDKALSYIISAAEQTERLDLPELSAPVRLDHVIKGWNKNRPLIFADETGGEPAIKIFASQPAPLSILIGPEGGFDADERAFLRAQEFVIPISLGRRILRADTAAIAALSLWQSVSGDW